MAAMVISISMVKGMPARSAAKARRATGATPIRQAATNSPGRIATPGSTSFSAQATASSAAGQDHQPALAP